MSIVLNVVCFRQSQFLLLFQQTANVFKSTYQRSSTLKERMIQTKIVHIKKIILHADFKTDN
jgi:hypothetical protein